MERLFIFWRRSIHFLESQWLDILLLVELCPCERSFTRKIMPAKPDCAAWTAMKFASAPALLRLRCYIGTDIGARAAIYDHYPARVILQLLHFVFLTLCTEAVTLFPCLCSLFASIFFIPRGIQSLRFDICNETRHFRARVLQVLRIFMRLQQVCLQSRQPWCH